MAQVHALVYPYGTKGPGYFGESREISDDLPQDTIGECVTEAVSKATTAGFPTVAPFCVLVTFTS